MTYARWSDEGPGLLVDSPPSICPDDCERGGTCQICGDTTCPLHALADYPEDTHVTGICVGVAHDACHKEVCRDSDCWAD